MFIILFVIYSRLYIKNKNNMAWLRVLEREEEEEEET